MDLFTFADRYGIPVAILVAVGYATYHTGRFVAYSLIVPIKDKIMEAIDGLATYFKDQALAREEMRKVVQSLKDEHTRAIQEISRRQEIQEGVQWQIMDEVREVKDLIEHHFRNAPTPRRRKSTLLVEREAQNPVHNPNTQLTNHPPHKEGYTHPPSPSPNPSPALPPPSVTPSSPLPPPPDLTS